MYVPVQAATKVLVQLAKNNAVTIVGNGLCPSITMIDVYGYE